MGFINLKLPQQADLDPRESTSQETNSGSFQNANGRAVQSVKVGTQTQAHDWGKKAPIEADSGPNFWNVFEPHMEKLELRNW